MCEVTEEFVTWSHPVAISQRSVVGLDLRPANFTVILYGCWIDTGMPALYWRDGAFRPSVGLS